MMKLLAAMLVTLLCFSIASAGFSTSLFTDPVEELLDPGDGPIVAPGGDPDQPDSPWEPYLFTFWGLSDIFFWMH